VLDLGRLIVAVRRYIKCYFRSCRSLVFYMFAICTATRDWPFVAVESWNYISSGGNTRTLLQFS